MKCEIHLIILYGIHDIYKAEKKNIVYPNSVH